MEFKYKNVLIMGYGKSGKSIEKLFINHKIKHAIHDKNIKLRGAQYLSKLTKKNLSQFDLIVVSPAFSRTNKGIVLANRLGIKVIGEIELGYLFCAAKIIGVTGTDGKTTTVNLIGDILSKAGKKVELLGNIGTPFCEIYGKKGIDYCVLELSSFQLETIDTFRPDIGVILNIDSDHIDRYDSVDDYVQAKLALFKNSGKDTLSVLNFTDLKIMENIDRIRGTKYYINSKNKGGLYIDKDNVFLADKEHEKIIEGISRLSPSSVFYDDILAAVRVALLLEIDTKTIVSALKSFLWLKHRVELVAEINGVKYINDSKATNFHASVAAIKAMDSQPILLMGGHNKGMGAGEFFSEVKPLVKKIVFFGKEVKREYKKCCKKYLIPCSFSLSLSDAVKSIKAIAQKGDIVLLSPCYSSFDAYTSYAQRGDDFIRLVKDEK